MSLELYQNLHHCFLLLALQWIFDWLESAFVESVFAHIHTHTITLCDLKCAVIDERAKTFFSTPKHSNTCKRYLISWEKYLVSVTGILRVEKVMVVTFIMALISVLIATPQKAYNLLSAVLQATISGRLRYWFIPTYEILKIYYNVTKISTWLFSCWCFNLFLINYGLRLKHTNIMKLVTILYSFNL